MQMGYLADYRVVKIAREWQLAMERPGSLRTTNFLIHVVVISQETVLKVSQLKFRKT